jgi:hypothetical protein
MSAPEPSDRAWTSDWEYIDDPVPTRYAVLWADLRSRTLQVPEESPRWRKRWRILSIDNSYAGAAGFEDLEGGYVLAKDLLVKRYDRHGYLYDPGKSHGHVRWSWIVDGVSTGRKQDLNAYRVDFTAQGGWGIDGPEAPTTTTTKRPRGRPPVENPSAATLRKRKQRERERMTKEVLREVKTSLDRIENKIDHEQALMALRFSQLLLAAEDQEVVQPEAD